MNLIEITIHYFYLKIFSKHKISNLQRNENLLLCIEISKCFCHANVYPSKKLLIKERRKIKQILGT